MLKIRWLQLGDGINAFFRAAVKENDKGSSLCKLTREDGSSAVQPAEIEQVVISFYKKLVGERTRDMTRLDLIALRGGKQISNEEG